MITRDDIASLIPEETSSEIFKSVVENSAILSLGRKLQNMARGSRRMSVMSALPFAYFVDGTPGDAPSDNTVGMKQTTTAEWANKYIYAEEIAVIAPIAISSLEDSEYDIFGELKPYIAEAFGAVIDAAVIHGTNAPASWPTNIVAAATAAGNVVDESTHAGDLYDEIMGSTGVISLLEQDGYFPTGAIGAVSMRGKLRGLRDDSGAGQPIFRTGMQGSTGYTLDGFPMKFPLNGALNATVLSLIVGDWTKLVYSIRTDMTYKVLDQAVIQDPTTQAIIYNLAQQDMVALRCYMRLGWQVPNPVNRIQPTEANRYPFSILIP